VKKQQTVNWIGRKLCAAFLQGSSRMRERSLWRCAGLPRSARDSSYRYTAGFSAIKYPSRGIVANFIPVPAVFPAVSRGIRAENFTCRSLTRKRVCTTVVTAGHCTYAELTSGMPWLAVTALACTPFCTLSERSMSLAQCRHLSNATGLLMPVLWTMVGGWVRTPVLFLAVCGPKHTKFQCQRPRFAQWLRFSKAVITIAIRLRHDYDVLRVRASIRCDSMWAKNEHVNFSS